MPEQTNNTVIKEKIYEQISVFVNGDYQQILALIKTKKDEVEKSIETLKNRKAEIEKQIEERLLKESAEKEKGEKDKAELDKERESLIGVTTAESENVSEDLDSKVDNDTVKVDEEPKTSINVDVKKPVENNISEGVQPKKEGEKTIRFYVPPEKNETTKPQRSPRPQQATDRDKQPQRPSSQSGQGGAFGKSSKGPQVEPQPIIGNPSKKKPQNDIDKHKRSSEYDNKVVNKKAQVNKGYMTDTSAVEYDDDGEIIKIRKTKVKKDKVEKQQSSIKHAVITTPTLTVKQLSEKIGKTGPEIINTLLMLDINKTINDYIDFETASLIASEFGITLELKAEKTVEEKLVEIHEAEDDALSLKPRPPIVTIMGHVDHGKTSILDYIRKSHVASGEAGGITQHIGAYTIKTNDGGIITFLDTPGHEAFTSMRMRGANVTDIAVIVVAADDGIMPQTVEAINHAKAAGVEIIVAINKMDKPAADPGRVLQQLTNYDIVPEEWGGKVPVVKVSAKTGENIDELLNTILLVAEMMELKANADRQAKGAIIEAKLDKGMGPVATVLVQNGTLKVGDYIIADTVTGKVRALYSDAGKVIKSAGPSIPVQVLGFSDVPNAGDQVMSTTDKSLITKVSELRSREKQQESGPKFKTLEDILNATSEEKLTHLNLIIKADVQGSVEAVKQSVEKLSNDEVKINIMHSGVGAINESDIMLAKTDYTIIIGFNVRPDNKAKVEAERAKIDIRTYRIIYDVIDDIGNAVKGLLSPKFNEKYMGRAEIRQVFRITGVGNVAGCMVKDGKIVRGAKVRLLREGVIVYEGEISSLKREKNDAKEVNFNTECGIGIQNFNDIQVGDVIESFVLEKMA